MKINGFDMMMKILIKKYTHLEIDKSFILDFIQSNSFPETNQAPRNISVGQTKQATSIYSTNYINRMDKSAIVLIVVKYR